MRTYAKGVIVARDILHDIIDHGLLDLSWGNTVWVTLALTHITIVSVTIYLHRHHAHHALVLHPAASHFFRFWLWLTTGMVTREWVAVHRKHHAKCEGPEDPHSPTQKGIKKVLGEGAELYRTEAAKEETLKMYGKKTPDDWMEQNVYTKHSQWGVRMMFVLDVVLFGPIGITVWAAQMMWIPFFAAGVINGLGHWWGYRTFNTKDNSHNIIPVGILIGGEELHNNHHECPSCAHFAARWFECDIGWIWISLFRLLRLARVT